MTQSSLHQPGFCAASSQVTVRAEPSAATTFISPDSISRGVHEMGLPVCSALPSLVTSASQVPSFTSYRRWVGPDIVDIALSRITSPRIRHASSLVSALMWMRSKKSQSAG